MTKSAQASQAVTPVAAKTTTSSGVKQQIIDNANPPRPVVSRVLFFISTVPM